MNDFERFRQGTYVEVTADKLHWVTCSLSKEERDIGIRACEHLHFNGLNTPLGDCLCFGEMRQNEEGDWFFLFIPALADFQASLIIEEETLEYMKGFIVQMVLNGQVHPRTPEGITTLSVEAPKNSH